MKALIKADEITALQEKAIIKNWERIQGKAKIKLRGNAMAQSYYQRKKDDLEFSLWREYDKYSDQALMDVLSSPKSIERYAAARKLQVRGGKKNVEIALHLTEDANYQLRAVGSFILGQIKCSLKNEQSAVHILCKLAIKDKSADVRCDAVAALGHICCRTQTYHATVMQSLKLTAYDKSPNVRRSTSFALFSIDLAETEALLLTLIKDKNTEVVDWALFSLNERAYDSQEIRDTMFALLPNEHDGIKMELITGLSQRKDKRIIPFLLDGLKQDTLYDYVLESIMALGDKSLLEPLKSILPRFEEDPLDNEVLTKLS